MIGFRRNAAPEILRETPRINCGTDGHAHGVLNPALSNMHALGSSLSKSCRRREKSAQEQEQNVVLRTLNLGTS